VRREEEVDTLDFTFEFHVEIPNLRDAFENELRTEAESRLFALAEGHTDLIGASVVLEQPARAESSYIYQARVVVYGRPDNMAAVEKDNTPESALRGALDAVERQVRERREKLAERWKQP
jgi:ribosome-associated translation inhibitor RaiA